jgi:flagellin
MTSINYNAAASSALRTLQSTNASLDATQNRISTGLKIGEAKDNAAYWSISTTLKSDNKAMGTVEEALGLGAATVDTAYQGLNAALDVLNEIKSKLTSASQEGVDKVAVQSEITELQKQLSAIASAATFSGENWLDQAAGAATTKNVVSSFNRSADGSVTIGTIEIDTTSMALVNAGDTGILDTVSTMSNGTFAGAVAFTGPQTVDADGLSFTVKVGSGPAIQVTINEATVDAALGTAADAAITSTSEYASVLNQALKNAGVQGVTAKIDGAGALTLNSVQDFEVGVATANGTSTLDPEEFGLDTAIDATTTAGGEFDASVLTLDITDVDGAGTDATRQQIEAMIAMVNSAANGVTAAASKLGAVSARIDLQKTFVTNLMDTIEKGISGLVDADMNEESTKLQALQVKQQLGVQALSIANQSAQNVLSLFRS